MKRRLLASLLGAAALAAPLHAIGAGIGATYRPITGNQWLVDFVVTGDGSPAVINNFTVYFPETSFAGLALTGNPSGWDSLVVQPDVALHSAGFLDSLALGSGITTGTSRGGFEVRFTFLGQGNPQALKFDVNDAAFNPIFSGVTSAVVAIPEPETAWLMLAGLGLFAARFARKPQTTQRSEKSA
ncbi:MAG: PEP-CTERM sorting domain-containing protein [Caldimonas sp.]